MAPRPTAAPWRIYALYRKPAVLSQRARQAEDEGCIGSLGEPLTEARDELQRALGSLEGRVHHGLGLLAPGGGVRHETL